MFKIYAVSATDATLIVLTVFSAVTMIVVGIAFTLIMRFISFKQRWGWDMRFTRQNRHLVRLKEFHRGIDDGRHRRPLVLRAQMDDREVYTAYMWGHKHGMRQPRLIDPLADIWWMNVDPTVISQTKV